MELSRSDFQILNVLKEHQCTNYQESMTLQEIIPELPFSRVTAYKRLKNLCDMGYTAKGCQAEQADTYYILEKGIRVADIKDITELSALLQWMWRSQIRNGKPIDIYIPSERMRELLNNWIQNCYVTEKAA